MRFFLVARDRVDGSLTLLNERTYHAREDAMDALLAEPPVLKPFTDVFAVDLEGSTPVLLLGGGRPANEGSPPGTGHARPEAESTEVDIPGADPELPTIQDVPTQVQPDPLSEGGTIQSGTIHTQRPGGTGSGSASVVYSSLTCDDCIYRSACRDAHHCAPAACGSFQRRSA